ncbi:unnamed protein product [Trifolium pratense]|uniref:Uncharacterized protein n=1 Tax=Trifolium pratense TaxID=57577 RepID=A0ACB0M127_TRIPR|nr:unnamed protein product [Trifolium pratense]
MASSSHFNNDVEDAAPPSSPRLSPALITDLQALPESDPRDGQATSWTSEDGDLVVLTERQAGKRPQSEQGKSAETDLSAASVTNAELAALIAALKQTTEALQGQNRRMDEQNLRLDRLERNQRFSRNNSPPRRAHTSQSPPRQETVRQRRPALERIEQPGKERDHVSPPREGISSPNVKKGKIVDRTPPRHHSPQGLSLMTKQGQPASRSHHTDQFSRSPTPNREGSPPLNSQESDEEDPRCPLSHDILQAPVPKGFERPPALPAYDGLTDPDEHIASGAMAWYHSLAPRSVISWMDLTDQFCRHFTASRKQPKTEAVLDAIFQADNESLRSFIERFNREAVQVETTDDMKKYLLQRGLRPNSDFARAVGIEKPRTFSDLLLKSQAYIQYEEQQAADAARYGRAGNNQPAPRSNAEQSSRGGGRRRGERPREPRGPPSTFSNYTPLTARRVFNASSKGNEYIGQLPESKKSKATTSLPLPEISSIDLDSRFSKQENKDEKKLRKEKKEDDEASQEHRRPVPDGEFELMPFGEDPSRAVKIGTGLPELARKQLEACLKENADLFAWHASEMPGLDPNVACHQLTIDPTTLPIVQRRRRQSPEKSEAAEKCVKDHLEANFISEARYTTWLSNVVLVKKSNGKWRMCCDYTDLNRACPKDSYPLPCIDRLVDNSSGFKLLSFMDAYSGYNQIPMAVADREKTAFMTESGNYYYNVMPFGLKNAGATYQRMMNKVFRGQIGDMLEVYMDDMIVKSPEELDHVVHLRKVFEQARKYNMRFNPEKCTFGVQAGKFLGFYLTERGIEANPDKCRAFAELPTPSDKKSIQTLNGMLTSLSRFVSKSAQHALPFFKLLKKEAVFEWTDECEQALQHLKKALSEPPVLSRPNDEEVLYLYLSVASEAVSAALIRETNEGQKPVYFTSKALQGPELRYQQIEKIALALVYAARRLRHYFLAHTIVVRTDQPIKSLLGRPDMAGRMLKWSLELSEFDIRYESRKALKAQILADFVAEMTSCSPTVDGADKWTIFVDGASSATGAGAGIILENENGLLIEVSLALSFPTSNNQAEYEAFLAGLRLAEDVQAKEIKIYTDSQLVASQVLGEYQTKNDNLSEYLVLVKEKITKFNSVEILHIPREHNKRADILSKLASTKRKGGNKSVIQEILPRPSIEKPSKVVDINVIGDKDCWMTPMYNFLEHGTLPDDQKQAAVIRRRACSYVILEGKLYRRGFSIPLLKCVDEDTADYILREVHEGINAQHLGGRSLARKALRAGYYWPTMQQDAKDHVKKCDKCQRHGDMHLAPPRELKSLSSPWPFAWWGMDLLGPFTKGLYQNRYLIVAVDYFTKWVEAEPLSDITSLRILRFFKRNVLARFGIPQVVVTDNGTQFTDKDFQAFLVALGTKQHFTSVEHPQTNGQAEAANRVILRGLRRRLDQNKKKWVEELDNVLWAYRTTPHSTTGETPFRMVYGTEAVIPVEIGEPSRRTEQPLDEEQNDEALREELDLVEEIRTGASLKEATLKQKIAARHDTKVIKREFEVGSLVLRRNADSQDGKLAPNWEGPYRVIDKTENGAYYLEDLRGKKLPRPWNAQKLKQYYS